MGILIFELMAGHPPFESAYPMQIYAKARGDRMCWLVFELPSQVTKGIGKVPFPSVIKGQCRNLIENMLKSPGIRF